MRAVLLSFLFVSFFTPNLFGQDSLRIHLSYSGDLFQDNVLKENCGRYTFKHASDSNYLKLDVLADVAYMRYNGSSPFYWLTKNAPNGYYEIYIDHFLRETFHVQNGRMLDTARNNYNYVISTIGLWKNRKEFLSGAPNKSRMLFELKVSKTASFNDSDGNFQTTVDPEFLFMENLDIIKYTGVNKTGIARIVHARLNDMNRDYLPEMVELKD